MAQTTRITSKIDGFRRAGMTHSKKAVDHKAGTFSKAQLKALMADPMLSVEIVGAPSGANISELLSGKVDDVIIKLADASDDIRAQALAAEQAKKQPRKGVLKALGAE